MGVRKKKYNWYDEYIEKPVRKIVEDLRKYGINTFCSCGHDMTIQCEYYGDKELTRIYTVLAELNIKNYKAIIIDSVEDGWRNTFMEIMLPDKNGNYICELKDNKDFIKNILKIDNEERRTNG